MLMKYNNTKDNAAATTPQRAKTPPPNRDLFVLVLKCTNTEPIDKNAVKMEEAIKTSKKDA